MFGLREHVVEGASQVVGAAPAQSTIALWEKQWFLRRTVQQTAQKAMAILMAARIFPLAISLGSCCDQEV